MRPVRAPPHLPRFVPSLVQTGSPPAPVVLDASSPALLGLFAPLAQKQLLLRKGVPCEQIKTRRNKRWP